MTSIEKHISTYVDIEIEIDDVLEFIDDADEDDIERILIALGKHNECGQLIEMDIETIKHKSAKLLNNAVLQNSKLKNINQVQWT